MLAQPRLGEGAPVGAAISAVDNSNVQPGYLIKAPYSYSQTFSIPAVTATSRYVEINFTFELLTQPASTSSDFVKQTTTDQLRVTLTP